MKLKFLNILFFILTLFLIVLSSPVTTLDDIQNLVNTKLFVDSNSNSNSDLNILNVINKIKKAFNNGNVDYVKLEEIFNGLFNVTVTNVENLIDSKNHKKFSVKNDGFYGELFEPEYNQYPNKALILCTGSDGDFSMVRALSNGLSDYGITVLGLGYFKVKDTPKSLNRIPLEYMEKAGQYLKSKGFKKIGIWGFSAGSVYALLSGVQFPDLFSLIIASSPGNYVFQNLDTLGIIKRSTFSYKGKDIPYERLPSHVDILRLVYLMIRDLEPNYLEVYEPAVTTASEDHLIHVEKMKARLIMFSGKLDHCWGSYKAGEAIMQRLNEKNYSYPHEHIVCEYGGHVMALFRTSMDILMKANRDYPDEAEEYRGQHLNILLQAFDEW